MTTPRAAALVCTLALATTAVAAPVGRWSFNETSGSTAFNSAPGPNGTLVGNAAFSPGGIAGNCLSLPVYGGGWVTMGNTYNIDANPEFSISLWIRTDDADDALVPLSRHFTGIPNGYIVGVNTLGGGYNNPLRSIFYVNDIPSSDCNGSTIVTDNQWHHLVCTYRYIGGFTIRELWVDGVREAANAFSGTNPHPIPSFMIAGVYNNSTGEVGAFRGQIDEVQVYDYAITAADIAAMHADPTAAAGPKQCFCDLNADAQRTTQDLTLLLARFGQPVSIGATGDINYDGVVNTSDLVILLSRFGQPCD